MLSFLPLYVVDAHQDFYMRITMRISAYAHHPHEPHGSASACPSLVDIHHIRLISLFRHFSDHIHFHGSAGLVPKLILTPCHIGIFSLIFINNIHLQAAGGMGSVAWPTSLDNTWKQGDKMVGNKSTIGMVEKEVIPLTVGRRRRWN